MNKEITVNKAATASTIKKSDLMSALAQLNGCAFAAIDSTTLVKLTGGKKNPMQGRVTKKTIGGNVMLFCNKNSNSYQNMVRKRLGKEGKAPTNFELSPRKWGNRIEETPFVHHKGKIYVEVIYLAPPKETIYFLDGDPIDSADIQGLPKKRESVQGGLENKVILRDYKLESIDRLKMGELSVM